MGACAAGFADCNGSPSDGCEVNLATDRSHCGACAGAGSSCAAGQVCASGVCAASCGIGLSNCAGGCTNTQFDPANCGGCGRSCAAGANARGVCLDGACATLCNAGFGDCNGNPADGCETRVDTVANCGVCNNACRAAPGADATCAGGRCGIACQAGRADCNGDASDGCEVDTLTSAAHCGRCGNACASGLCAAGACVSGGTCRGGAVTLSRAPSGTEVLCDDPTNATCEQDFEALCPASWHLCTRLEHNARNAGWSYVPSQRTLGVIYCRPGSSGAGHLTFPDASQATSLPMSTAVPFNCYFGSSRPSCTASYGCNEQSSYALCCAPNPNCGNGRLDAEEECDDGNTSDTDACLSTCTWRVPTEHGLTGTNC
jgi:hypothetical protein